VPGRGGGSVTGWSRWWCRGASLLLSRSRSSGGAPRRAVLGLVARVGGGRSVHWAPACLVRWACCAAALTGGGPVGWVSGQVALCGLSRSSSRSTLAVHVILPLRLILLSSSFVACAQSFLIPSRRCRFRSMPRGALASPLLRIGFGQSRLVGLPVLPRGGLVKGFAPSFRCALGIVYSSST